jgi:hypothetical protein
LWKKLSSVNGIHFVDWIKRKMKWLKSFIMISAALLVFWTARNVHGSDRVSQTWLPGETFFSDVFTLPSPVLGPGYNTALPGVNGFLSPFLKLTMEETAQQGLKSQYPMTTIRSYKNKSGGGGLLAFQNSFYGYFWDTSGRIKNTKGTHGFADLAHTFGPATFHIYFGQENTKNSNEWKIGDDDMTRRMFSASIDYRVAGDFYVIPVLTYYDWGNSLDVASKPDINKEWIGGLQFRLVF